MSDFEEPDNELGVIFSLPATPVVYLSLMKTLEGKPVGIPIWSSFENQASKRTLENEAMSSTFLSLAKTVSEMTDETEKDGKIVRITINQKTYNFFLPHSTDKFQVSFVIVFEEQDKILVRDEYKVELVKIVTKTLRKNKYLLDFLNQVEKDTIEKNDEAYNKILSPIFQNIIKWDKKRVDYLAEKKEEREIKRKREEAAILAALKESQKSEAIQNTDE